tara:strand:+ start:5333 stop:5488 length:156 start_codon:yes stop_codon:yes gene_type:complete
MKNYKVNYRKAGPLKVTKADGTITIEPALKSKELLTFLEKSGNIRRRRKKK